jgi:hypothetical protein
MASKGKAPSFERYLAKFPPSGPGWAEIITSIARACGPENVTVWTYDWFRDDPARVVSLLAPGMTFDIPEDELRRDVLPSLTTKGLKVMAALEDLLSAGERERMARLLRNFEFDEPNPRLEIADESLLAAYEAKYRTDLERIAAAGVQLHA